MNFEHTILSGLCAAVVALFALVRMDTLATRKKLDARDQAREKERHKWDEQRGKLWKSMKRLENRVAVVESCPVQTCPSKMAFLRMKQREDQEDSLKNHEH